MRDMTPNAYHTIEAQKIIGSLTPSEIAYAASEERGEFRGYFR